MSEEQQQLPGLEAQDDEQPEKKPRGGARDGAGRKPRAMVKASRIIRVPEDYLSMIRALIQHLDETTWLGARDPDHTSPQYFQRSIMGRAQFISFTTSGKVQPGTEAIGLPYESRQPRHKKKT